MRPICKEEQQSILDSINTFLQSHIEYETKENKGEKMLVQDAIAILSSNPATSRQSLLPSPVQYTITKAQENNAMLSWFFEDTTDDCLNRLTVVTKMEVNVLLGWFKEHVKTETTIPDAKKVREIFRKRVLMPHIEHTKKIAAGIIRNVIDSATTSSFDEVTSTYANRISKLKYETSQPFADIMKSVMGEEYLIYEELQEEFVNYMQMFEAWRHSKDKYMIEIYMQNSAPNSHRRMIMTSDMHTRLKRTFDGWTLSWPNCLNDVYRLSSGTKKKLLEFMKDKYSNTKIWNENYPLWTLQWIEKMIGNQKSVAITGRLKGDKTSKLQLKFDRHCIFKTYYDRCIEWMNHKFTINELIEISKGTHSHYIPLSFTVEYYQKKASEFLSCLFTTNDVNTVRFRTILGWTHYNTASSEMTTYMEQSQSSYDLSPLDDTFCNPSLISINAKMSQLDKTLNLDNFKEANDYIRRFNNKKMYDYLKELEISQIIKKNSMGLYVINEKQESFLLDAFENVDCKYYLLDPSNFTKKSDALPLKSWLDIEFERYDTQPPHKKRKLNCEVPHDFYKGKYDELTLVLGDVCIQSLNDPEAAIAQLRLLGKKILETGSFL